MINKILNDLKTLYINKPHRYKHVLGVRDTALKLAEIHNVDKNKLELAALLHDITKYHDTSWHQQQITNNFDNSEEILSNYNSNILHAFSAYIVAQKEYNINDHDILDAILNHTIGKPNMTIYEKIIFISDYIEPNRTYESCKKVRQIAFDNLDLAVYTAIDDSIKFYEKNNGDIPDIAYEARAFYHGLGGQQ